MAFLCGFACIVRFRGNKAFIAFGISGVVLSWVLSAAKFGGVLRMVDSEKTKGSELSRFLKRPVWLGPVMQVPTDAVIPPKAAADWRRFFCWNSL